MSVNNVEIFRTKLQCTLKSIKHNPDTTSSFFLSILRGLIVDFENLFSKEIYSTSKNNIYKYIDKFCIEDKTKCPICGSILVKRKAKTTNSKFFGCSKFPICKGSRTPEGEVSITPYLRSFLAKKIYEIAEEEESNPLNRFDKLDYE